jgi:hypothetical protein
LNLASPFPQVVDFMLIKLHECVQTTWVLQHEDPCQFEEKVKRLPKRRPNGNQTTIYVNAESGFTSMLPLLLKDEWVTRMLAATVSFAHSALSVSFKLLQVDGLSRL